MTVPALPGSRTVARTATRRGAAARTAERRTFVVTPTASTCWASGLIASRTSDEAVVVLIRARAASATISPYRCAASSVT
jgi:hypothetical protein